MLLLNLVETLCDLCILGIFLPETRKEYTFLWIIISLLLIISRTAFRDQKSIAKESIGVTEFNSEIRFDVIGLLFRLQ